MSATPRPWRTELAVSYEKDRVVQGENGNIVLWCGYRHPDDPDRAKDNAELIVRAVNAHEALVEALKEQIATCMGSRCAPGERCGVCERSEGALRLAGALE